MLFIAAHSPEYQEGEQLVFWGTVAAVIGIGGVVVAVIYAFIKERRKK